MWKPDRLRNRLGCESASVVVHTLYACRSAAVGLGLHVTLSISCVTPRSSINRLEGGFEDRSEWLSWHVCLSCTHFTPVLELGRYHPLIGHALLLWGPLVSTCE